MEDKDKMKEHLKEITDKLEQGIKEVFESDKYKEYLNTMSKFYNYSFNNTMLISMQKPDATLIAGFNAWKDKFGRHVLKGEKGIRIIAPAPIIVKEEMEKLDPITQEPILDEKGKPITEVIETTTKAFKVIPVFDVSQTEGKPLPEMTAQELSGNVKDYDIFMEALTQTAPVPIGYEEIADGAKGYYHIEEKRIAIQQDMSQIQTVKTAIHEISHATIHYNDLNKSDMEIPLKQRKDRKTKEVEAESIAYTVCQHYGIDTSDYSFEYIAGWSSGKEISELRSSLETIRKTASKLITQIGERLQELNQSVEQEKTEVKLILADGEEHIYSYPYKAIAIDIEEMGGDRTAIFKAEKDIQDSVLAGIHNAFHGIDFEMEAEAELGIEWIESINYADGSIITRDSVVIQKTEALKTDFSVMKRVEKHIDLLEAQKTIFTDEERNLIINYAYKLDKFEKAIDLADLLAFQLKNAPNLVAQTVISTQAEIDALPDEMLGMSEMHEYGYFGEEMWPLTKERAAQLFAQEVEIYKLHVDDSKTLIEDVKELKEHEGIFGVKNNQWERHQGRKQNLELEESNKELEAHFPLGEQNHFAILQLKRIEETKVLRFMNLDFIEKQGLEVNKDNYDLLYTAPLKEGQALDDIFEEFNMFRPEDFKGHSLSISDIVVLQQNGKVTAYFVDSIGFTEIPDFFLEKHIEQENKAFETVESLRLGDALYLTDGQVVLIAEEQEINRTGWRKNLKGLDNSTGEMRKFHYHEVERINFAEGGYTERIEEAYIDHFYVIEDRNERDYKTNKYPDYQSAKKAYFELPYDKVKALGVENIHKGSLDFIQCKNGVDEILSDYKKVSGWNNADVFALTEQIQWDVLLNERQEIAYAFEDKFISIHSCEDGFDYDIYDKDYRLLDGGVYEDSNISIYEASLIVLDIEGSGEGKLQIVSFDALEEWTEKANAIIPESSLKDIGHSEIEETVMAYAQKLIDEYDLDAELVDAKVYGSRGMGKESEDSDLDVVLEYKSETMKEDAFFNLLHENEFEIEGMKVDINPITADKSGTIEEYLQRANQYLQEKTAGNIKEEKKQQEEPPEQTITFYVAECMEFPMLGEYHDGLTLIEAAHILDSIPAERMNGGKGIGFTLHTIGTEPYMDSTFGICSFGTIDVDMINHVKEFRDNALVQQAITDIKKLFPNAEVMDMETRERESLESMEAFEKDCESLAVQIDNFSEQYSPYEYRDSVEDKEENIAQIVMSLREGQTEHIKDWLTSVIEEEEPLEDVAQAEELLKKIDGLEEGRDKNPLTKAEELEEANYNQVDGVLNNLKPKEEKKSIREAMKEKKEQIIKQDGKVEKKKEIGIE